MRLVFTVVLLFLLVRPTIGYVLDTRLRYRTKVFPFEVFIYVLSVLTFRRHDRGVTARRKHLILIVIFNRGLVDKGPTKVVRLRATLFVIKKKLGPVILIVVSGNSKILKERSLNSPVVYSYTVIESH